MNQAASPKVELQHPEPSHVTHSSPRGDVVYPTTQLTAPLAGTQLRGFDDIDITVPPSALTSSTAYDPHCDSPSPLEDYPRSRSHQRNLTGTFLDNITSTIQQHTSAASFRSHSPTKSLASFIPSRSAIESTANQPKIKALQNWFNGSGRQHDDDDSASGSEFGSESETGSDYDSDEEEEEHGTMNIFNRIASNPRAASESPSRANDTPVPAKAQNQTTASSRFAWLLSTQKNAAVPTSTKSPTYHNADDELLNLNISQALFPHGPVDPLAPSSFNDLLTNAEALISRYQKSYRQLSTALVDAQSEQSAQDDELDEAETRARHLKMQLETMAARATEQDEQMRILMEDLAFERRARQEEEAARAALARAQTQCSCADANIPRRRNRVSNSHASIDSGFESECDTDAASVFSRTCLSPTGTDRSSILDVDPLDTPKARTPQALQRGSAYDKPRAPVNLQTGGWGCTNCEGGRQAAVWGRLAKEREDNRSLRQRVETLEEAVESALDVVGGVWAA